MNRRSFFQAAFVSIGALGLFSIAQAEERRRGGSAAAAVTPQLVDPKDAAAKAVNYVTDHAQVSDKALQTERSGVKFNDQHCSGCSFYQKDKEASVSGKKAAPCQMPFAAGKFVVDKAWCSSWAKKA